MSGLDKIISEIEKDAKQLAKNQLDEASEKAKEILAEVEVYKKEQTEKAVENAKIVRENALERAKSSAELQSRKAVLNKKQELISKTINKAKASMENLENSEYFALLLKLADKYSNGENAVLKLNDKDLQNVTADFKANLPKCIQLSDTACDIKNGFLLIYDGIDINCSFDSLFEEKNELLQDKAAQVLFS